MADEKVNVSPEESKTPEAPAPSGPGDLPALSSKVINLFAHRKTAAQVSPYGGRRFIRFSGRA